MSVRIEKHFFEGNGRVPNSRLPLLIYRGVIKWSAADMESVMRANHWMPTWHAHEGMWPHHHFHSEAHEIIAVTRGTHEGKFGGHDGIYSTVTEGDVLVIPAGVGHLGRGFSDDLNLTGGFPSRQGILDFRMGRPEEYEETRITAAGVPIGSYDPFFGIDGPLVKIWQNAERGIRTIEPEIFDDELLSQPKGERP